MLRACVLLSVLLALSIEPAAAAVGDEVCIVGYVMDTLCLNSGSLMDMPAVRSLEEPEKHTFRCLVDVPACVNSGFEVLPDKAPGRSEHCRGLKLDSSGNQKALELARATGKGGEGAGCTTCTNTASNAPVAGFRATVKGTLTADPTDPSSPGGIAVTSIQAASVGCGTEPQYQHPFCRTDGLYETQEFVGFLVDMLCTTIKTAPDGADMILAPEEHTVMCALLPACLRSGFGVTQNIGTGEQKEYRPSASFNEEGNRIVEQWLRTMPPSKKDLLVQVRGSAVRLNGELPTPRDTQLPPLYGVPVITVDSIRLCNYEGPDSRFTPPSLCTAPSLITQLGGDRAGLLATGASMCFRSDAVTIDLTDPSVAVVSSEGCADHGTFKDVKRAGRDTCTLCDDLHATPPAPSCKQQCVDGCGNPLLRSPNGRKAAKCCLDACGNPILNPCGFPYYDPCGNPAMNASGSACAAQNIGENKLNECVDACGNPYRDACGKPVTACCLDACGNPVLNGCGDPSVDGCGNPTNACGAACAGTSLPPSPYAMHGTTRSVVLSYGMMLRKV